MPSPSPTRALWRHFRPTAGRAFHCRCGRPIFFRNSQCLTCGRALGYDAERVALWAIEPEEGGDGTCWQAVSPEAPAEVRFHRCANLSTAAGCNWLIEIGDAAAAEGTTLCRACRLNRTIPDQGDAQNQRWWGAIETAKRRLVSSLIALGLPVRSRVSEDPERGLAFDLLRGTPAQRVMTGHDDGIVTLDIEEADDARREAVRTSFGEPYRTLLGHLRHETGHYYWQRLVENSDWHAPYRALFGDERADYGQALQRHHAEGPPADWPQQFVSAYASAHPWEDWAETWAHYLHMTDTLDTALSFGLDGSRAELLADPLGADALWPDAAQDDDGFLAFANAWVELTGILNELSRSMGLHDFYPFVLAKPAIAKLHFVHKVVQQTSPG